jgi:hypothetical protein
MIEPGHPRLSIVRQCELASISRSSFYGEPPAERSDAAVDAASCAALALNSAENRLRFLMVIRPLHRRIHLGRLVSRSGTTSPRPP